MNDPHKLAQLQRLDPLCNAIFPFLHNPSLATKSISRHFKFVTNLIKQNAFYVNYNNILCIKSNAKYPNHRIVIPQRLIKTVLLQVHSSIHSNHPGIIQTRHAIECKYWWYQYSSDVTAFVQQCNQCQLTKGYKSQKIGKLNPIFSSSHGEIVHFDFAGPFHKSLNIMVIVDNYTGAVMFVPCTNQTAATVIECILQHWLPIHGMPRSIITDQGRGFIDRLNIQIYELLGIRKLFTSRYHPQSNAKAERMVQELKKQLRLLNISLDNALVSSKHSAHAIRQIKLLLPSIQFATNQRCRNFCKTSPHEMLYGTNLHDIQDIALKIKQLSQIKSNTEKSKHELIEQLKTRLSALHTHYDNAHQRYVIIMKRNFDRNKSNPIFKINDLVAYYVGDRANTSKKLRRRFTGPWRIINKISHNTYEIINDDTGDTMSCHAQMLKTYHKNDFTPLNDFEATERNKFNLKRKYNKHHKKLIQMQNNPRFPNSAEYDIIPSSDSNHSIN